MVNDKFLIRKNENWPATLNLPKLTAIYLDNEEYCYDENNIYQTNGLDEVKDSLIITLKRNGNINMDLFEEWLNKKYNKNIKRALTAASYKNIDNSLSEKDIANDLATYGDALIRFCYAKILLDKCTQYSKEIEKYVTDERFVSIIARHYDLLKYIRFDCKDVNIVKDYDYKKPNKTSGNNKKDSPHKYIATAVEAMVAAIYLNIGKKFKPIIKLMRYWMYLKN